MTDGNGEEDTARGGGSDEEAAWLDLIGRFDAPAGSPGAPVPWPDREDLGPPRRSEESGPSPEAADTPPAGGTAGPWTDANPATDAPGPGRDSATDAPGPGADGPVPGTAALWAAPGDALTAGGNAAGDGAAGADPLPDGGAATDGRFGLPAFRPLELPAVAGPTSPRAKEYEAEDDEDDEEHYIPPPPPPLPTLAPGTKAAWTGLFGGPGYLLVATLAGWSVPAWALLLAIAAFVGGFTVLVLRQEDPPDSDSGPDDGAVV